MKALVYDRPRQVSVKDVPDAKIERPTEFKGQTLGSGQCSVKKYNRGLRDLIAAGKATPSFIVSHELSLEQGTDAYSHFDARDDGWTKVVLKAGSGQRLTGSRRRDAGARAAGGLPTATLAR